jgi:hypothetical protein|eukprot:g2917.t1
MEVQMGTANPLGKTKREFVPVQTRSFDSALQLVIHTALIQSEGEAEFARASEVGNESVVGRSGMIGTGNTESTMEKIHKIFAKNEKFVDLLDVYDEDDFTVYEVEGLYLDLLLIKRSITEVLPAAVKKAIESRKQIQKKRIGWMAAPIPPAYLISHPIHSRTKETEKNFAKASEQLSKKRFSTFDQRQEHPLKTYIFKRIVESGISGSICDPYSKMKILYTVLDSEMDLEADKEPEDETCVLLHGHPDRRAKERKGAFEGFKFDHFRLRSCDSIELEQGLLTMELGERAIFKCVIDENDNDFVLIDVRFSEMMYRKSKCCCFGFIETGEMFVKGEDRMKRDVMQTLCCGKNQSYKSCGCLIRFIGCFVGTILLIPVLLCAVLGNMD